jgi:TRAP-type C4-dicarboxylate transport system permease small subunit
MKLKKIIDSGIPVLCGALLVIMVGLTFMEIILRNCFRTGINWSNEVSQFCMMWMVLFGLIWVGKNNQHLKAGLKLHKKLNERQICLIDGLLDLFFSVVIAVVAYHTAMFTFTALRIESLSLRWVKMGYIFIAMPIVMLSLCYYFLKSFFEKMVRIFKKN